MTALSFKQTVKDLSAQVRCLSTYDNCEVAFSAAVREMTKLGSDERVFSFKLKTFGKTKDAIIFVGNWGYVVIVDDFDCVVSDRYRENGLDISYKTAIEFTDLDKAAIKLTELDYTILNS